MKKIDIKNRMEEKVRSTEWTDRNTWNVLDRIRKAKSAPRFRWSPALLPAAAVLVLVVCLGVTSLIGPKGGPDQIRNQNLHTLQPVATSLSQGDGQEGEGPASPDTVLYYNPDGGSKYHLDPNCKSVLPKYQPLEAQFTYAEVNDEQYRSLEPCEICSAPGRSPDTAGDLPAADSAGQAESEMDNIIMGQVDEAVAEATRQVLRDKYPGWAEQLIPLNVSCENQGIRMEVLGALVKGNDSTLLCALQDLEGDRINESTLGSQYEDRDNLGSIHYRAHNPVSYDPENHRLIYLNQKEYRQMDKPADGIYRLSMDRLSSYKKETPDLAPLLEQHGKSVAGIRLPEEVKPYSSNPLPEDLRVLDYTDPLNIPLNERGNILLTGIGWINGQLHVQVLETGDSSADNYSYIYSLSCKAGNDSIYSQQIIYWNIDEPGLQGEMEEYIFNVDAEKTAQMEMSAEIINYTSRVTGPWEIRFPLSPVSVEGINFGDFDEVEDLLQPLNLADEKQGFRMEVHSAYAEKDTLWITYSLRNLDGNHVLDKNSDCPDLVCSAVPVSAENTVKFRDYNEEEQKLICKSCIQYRAQFPEENLPVTVRFDLWPVIKENISFSFSFMLNSIRPAADGSAAPVSVPDAAEGDPSGSAYAQVILDSFKERYPEIADKLQPVNLSREDRGIRLDVHYIAWADNKEYIIYSLQDLEDGRDGEIDSSTAFSSIRYTDGHANITGWLCENEYNNQRTYINVFDTLHEYPGSDPVETYPSAINLDYVLISKWLSLDVTPQVKENAAAVEGIESPELLTDSLVRGEDDVWRVLGNNTVKVLDYTHPLDLPLYKTVSLTGAGWIDGKLHVQAHNKDAELLSSTGHHRVELSDASLFIQYDDMHNGTLVWDDNGDKYPEWYEYTFSVSPEDLQQNHNLYLHFNEYTDCLQGDWTIPLPRPNGLPETESTPVSTPVAEEPVPATTAFAQNIISTIQYDYPEIADKLQPVNLSREDQGIRLHVHYIAWADNQEYIVYSLQDLEEDRDGEMEAAGFSNIRYTDCAESQENQMSTYYNDNHPIYVQVLSTLQKNPDGTSAETYPSTINLDHVTISKSLTLDVLPMVKEYAAAVEGVESPKLLPGSSLLDPSSSEIHKRWTNYPQEKATVLDYTRPLDIPLYGTVSLTGAGWIDGKLHVQTHNEDTELFSVTPYHRTELTDSASLQTHSHNCQLKWGDNDDDTPEWREYIFDVSPEDLEQADYLHLYVTEYTDYLQGDWTIPLPRPDGLPETESSPAAEEPVPAETPAPQQNISRASSPDEMFPINLSRENQGIRFELIAGKVDNDSAGFRCAVEDLEGRYSSLQLDPSFRFDNIATYHNMAYSPTDDKDSEHRKLFDISPKFEEPVDPAPRDITARIDSLLIEDKASIDVSSLLEQYGQSAEGIAPPKAVRTYYNRSVAIPEDLKVLDYTNPLNIPLLEDVYLTGIGWINGRLHIQLHNTNPAHIYRGSTDYTKWHVYISGAEYPDYAPVKWSEDGSDDAAWVECILDTAPETVSMDKPVLFLTVVRDVLKDDAWSITVPLDSVWAGSTETAEIREEPASAADIADTADSVPADTPDAIPAGYNNVVNAKNQLLRFFCDWAQGDMDSLVGETTVAWRLATEDHAAALAKLTAGVPLSFQVNSLASDPGSSDQVADCVVKMDPLDGSEPRYERIQIRLRNEEDDSHYEVVPESLAAREPAQPLPDKEIVPLSEEAITNFNLDTYFSGVRENLIPVNLSQEAQGIRMTVISALVKEQESWIVYSLEDLEGRCSGCDFYHDSLDTSDIGNFKSFSSFPLFSSARQHKAVLMDHVRFDSPVDTSDRVIHIRKSSLRNYKSRFMDFAPLIAQYAVTTEGVDRPSGNGYVNPEADVPKVLDWSNSLDIPVTEDGFLSAIGWIDGRLHIQFRTTNTFSFHNAMFTEYNGGKAKTKYWNDGNTRVYWRDGSTQFIEHVINYQPADPENTHLEGCLDYTEDLLPRLNLTVEVPLSSILAD